MNAWMLRTDRRLDGRPVAAALAALLADRLARLRGVVAGAAPPIDELSDRLLADIGLRRPLPRRAGSLQLLLRRPMC
jgi:hypothetical protein